MIILPYGGEFDEAMLIEHMKVSGRDFIVQGQQSLSYKRHTKPHSLDYWIRQFADNPDTKQAENSVIDQLVATGRFRVARKPCPDSGRSCKGVELIKG